MFDNPRCHAPVPGLASKMKMVGVRGPSFELQFGTNVHGELVFNTRPGGVVGMRMSPSVIV